MEVHLAISPSGPRANGIRGSTVEAVKEEVSPQLGPRDAVVLDGTLDFNMPTSAENLHMKKQNTPTEVSNERLIPQRADRNVSLRESEFTSSATYCISILVLVFLFTSAAHITVERACRWMYPSELESSDPQAEFDEFEQTVPQDRDFRMFRALLEVSKLPMGAVAAQGILMYVVQARARELTRGFGDSPEWAETSMKILTAADLLLVVITCVQAWVNGGDRMANKKQVVLNLFANPNWIFVTSMTVVALTQFVNVILLANCAATMTPEDCQVPPELAQGLWQGQQP